MVVFILSKQHLVVFSDVLCCLVPQEEWAAKKVQGLFRQKKAWKNLMFMLNNVYEKEYDPDTDGWFYVNKVRHLFLLVFPTWL